MLREMKESNNFLKQKIVQFFAKTIRLGDPERALEGVDFRNDATHSYLALSAAVDDIAIKTLEERPSLANFAQLRLWNEDILTRKRRIVQRHAFVAIVRVQTRDALERMNFLFAWVPNGVFLVLTCVLSISVRYFCCYQYFCVRLLPLSLTLLCK